MGYVDHKKHIGVDIIYAVVQDKADNALLRIDNKEQTAAEEPITSSAMPGLSKLIPSSLAASAELKGKIALF
jgi:hypothetical protein